MNIVIYSPIFSDSTTNTDCGWCSSTHTCQYGNDSMGKRDSSAHFFPPHFPTLSFRLLGLPDAANNIGYCPTESWEWSQGRCEFNCSDFTSCFMCTTGSYIISFHYLVLRPLSTLLFFFYKIRYLLWVVHVYSKLYVRFCHLQLRWNL
jgi:hypothetical protein